MKKQEAEICVILTGGTICSVPGKNGKNQSDASETSTHLEKYFLKDSDSPFQGSVKFDYKSLNPDILSENMTANAWNDLIKIFKEIAFEDYEGIIVLHGTDTLAYTSSFLSFALAGIKIPVCMVSAQLRLGQTDENGEWEPNRETNGYANFRAAVELIMNGIQPNVYAVYRNEANEHNGKHEPGAFLVHYGAHLLQCPNASNNFHSRDEMLILDTDNAKLKGKKWESNGCLYQNINEIKDAVLMLHPYTNLNYDAINLEGRKLIIHGTYHSESVCIGRVKEECKKADGKDKDAYKLEEIMEIDKPYSILYLLEKCKKLNIPVLLVPCDIDNANYGTTYNAYVEGAVPIGSSTVTIESVYAKAVLGCSLGKEGDDLTDFLQQSINHETIYTDM